MEITIQAGGVDIKSVIQSYIAGKYKTIDNIKLHSIKKRILEKNNIIGKTHGVSSIDELYRYSDRNDSKFTVQTSNHKNFQLFNENGGNVKQGGVCEYCRYSFNTYCIGYPVSFFEKNIQDEEKRTKIFYVFNMKGEFCTFECTRAYIELLASNLVCSVRTEAISSLQGLLFLYRLLYGQDELLKCANDKYLLENNGGTLTREEWIKSSSIYIPTGKIICAPVKSEFILNNLELKRNYKTSSQK